MMTIKEYKDIIRHHLEIANDCADVEQIINNSIDKMNDKNLHPYLINGFLHKLKDSLEELSSKDFDQVHWCNIRCAILHLKRLVSK